MIDERHTSRHDCPSNRTVARDLRRSLLVWQADRADVIRRFDAIERAVRRRFADADLPGVDLPIAIRLPALEQALDRYLQPRRNDVLH